MKSDALENISIKARLQGGLSHAYLISGEDGGEGPAAILAKALVCPAQGERPCGICPHCEKAERGIHPDIVVLDRDTDEKGREKGEIVIAQVRRIVADAYILPNEAAKKVYLIKNADSMNTSAQNALLKLLEEPPPHAVFLLAASNPLTLLPTIRSRCQRLSSPPGPGEAGSEPPQVLEFFSALRSGGLALLDFCAGLEKLDRNAMQQFISMCHSGLVEMLKRRDGYLPESRILTAIALFDTLGTYQAANVSSGHIAGMIGATLTQ